MAIDTDSQQFSDYDLLKNSVLVFDMRDLKIVFINDAFSDRFGFSQNELSGCELSKCFSAESTEKLLNVKSNIMVKKTNYMTTLGGLVLVDKTGCETNADVTLTLKNDSSHCGFLTIKPVSKASESFVDKKQLEHLSSLAELGQVAATLVHEIKNPLTIIMTVSNVVSEMEKTNSLTNEDMKKHFATITRAGSRIDKIINSTLKQVKSGEDNFEKNDLREIIEDVLSLSEKQMVGLNVELDKSFDESVVVDCRQFQIEQVLLNLLNNAIHAVEERESERKIRISLTGGESPKISVWNNGPAIPKEIQEKVIKPFFTTKPDSKGTGLGLSVCCSIMHEHGGRMEFDSSAEKGTAFTISFSNETQDIQSSPKIVS